MAFDPIGTIKPEFHQIARGQKSQSEVFENIVGDGTGHWNILIFGKAHRLVPAVNKLMTQFFKRHAVLQSHRNRDGKSVQKSGQGRTLLGDADKNFGESAIFVNAVSKKTLVPGDAEFMRFGTAN